MPTTSLYRWFYSAHGTTVLLCNRPFSASFLLAYSVSHFYKRCYTSASSGGAPPNLYFKILSDMASNRGLYRRGTLLCQCLLASHLSPLPCPPACMPLFPPPPHSFSFLLSLCNMRTLAAPCVLMWRHFRTRQEQTLSLLPSITGIMA